MATASVAAALALPEVVAAVDSFNELLPGVPASKENLQPLLEHLRTRAVQIEDPTCRIEIEIKTGSRYP